MYQFIDAAISGITGMCGVIRYGRANKKETASEVSKYLDVAFVGVGITVCLLLAFTAVELAVYSLPVSAYECVAIMTILAAIYTATLLIKHELKSKNIDSYKYAYKMLVDENERLECRVNDLVTHSDISHAAASSKTFSCFMGSIASLLRKEKSARELTIFSCNEGRILPHTYYQISDFSELSLSFSGGNLVKIENDYQFEGKVDPEFFDATNLVLEYVEGNITIDGGLLYKACSVGRLRVTIFNCSEKSHSFKELLEGIVQNALSSVNIECDGVEEAVLYDSPVMSENDTQGGSMMLQLKVNEAILGVVKLDFENPTPESIAKQENLLVTASGHIGKALYNQNLYELAIKDGLTGLYNKRYLQEVLEKTFGDVILGCDKVSFVLVDIDHFKNVNDTWGHVVGDEVLRRVSDIIAETARESDVVCRYGGEEIAILMPETLVTGAEILSERIRENIERERFVSSDGDEFGVTASFGIAGMNVDTQSPAQLIDTADKALYLAKNSGRNKVVVSGSLSVVKDVA